MKQVLQRYDQLSQGNDSSFKQVMERYGIPSPFPSFHRKFFITCCCFPVNPAFNQGVTSNHHHGDGSMCELSHCPSSARQTARTTVRQKRSFFFRQHLLPQVLRCTAQSDLFWRTAPSWFCLVTSSRASTLCQSVWPWLRSDEVSRSFQLFPWSLQGRLNLFFTSVLLRDVFIFTS